MKVDMRNCITLIVYLSIIFTGAVMAQLYQVDEIKGPVCVVRDSLTGKTTTVSPEISRFDVIVTDGIARITLTQLFINPFKGVNDIIYVFPLPHDGAVYAMSMEYKKKLYIAEIYEKKDAINKYDSVKTSGGIAALLLQERPNVFQQRLANIAKGDTAYIKIEVVTPLKYDNGNWELAIPTMVGERYQSENSSTVPSSGKFWNPPAERNGQSLQMNVLVQTGFPITNLTSPSHALSISQLTEPSKELVQKNLLGDGEHFSLPYNQYALLHSAATYPNRDFVLRFSRQKSEQKFTVASYFDPKKEKGYFSLSCFPDDSLFTNNRPDLEIVLLVDISGSQSGWPLEKEKQISLSVLNRLAATDRFTVLAFSDNVYWCFEDKQPRVATAENVTKAKTFIQQLTPMGGTDLLNGVKEALNVASTSEHSRYYMFMTDGFITNESAIIDEIKQHPSKPVVFTFGAGNNLNRYFLELSAQVGNGFATEIMQDEDVELAVNNAWQKIESPQIKNVTVQFSGAPLFNQIFPSGGNLYSGCPLTMHGMYSTGGEQTVTVSGYREGSPVSFTEKIVLSETYSANIAISKIWAKQKISALSVDEGVTEKNKDSIIAISIEHQILSKYTAFLAINAVSIEDGESMRGKFTKIAPEFQDRTRIEAAIGIVVKAGFITLTIPANESICSIKIYDLKGRLIVSLPGNVFSKYGSVRWNGMLPDGVLLKYGKYIIKVVTNKRAVSLPLLWNSRN